VRAAAYDSQLLVDKLASLHATIRKSKDAKRTRGERSERGLDGTKTPILLRTRGGTLEAERLDYDVTPGSSSMSVAVRTPVPQSAPLACNEQVIVSADKLHLSDRPMRVTHLHCVNGIVCRRREHTTCLRAGDGQFFVGLNSVA
jgi:hypothetical protein